MVVVAVYVVKWKMMSRMVMGSFIYQEVQNGRFQLLPTC
jgi:hypothetical protein